MDGVKREPDLILVDVNKPAAGFSNEVSCHLVSRAVLRPPNDTSFALVLPWTLVDIPVSRN